MDVRDRLADPPTWVPAMFLRYVPTDKTSIAGDAMVLIKAPEGHPWARHNGTEFLTARHYLVEDNGSTNRGSGGE